MLASYLLFKYILEKAENKQVKMRWKATFFASDVTQPNITMTGIRKI